MLGRRKPEGKPKMSDTPERPTAPRGWVPSDTGGQGGKLHAPAVERNTAPILAVLTEVIAGIDPPPRRALELASGSGEHAIAITQAFPDLAWQPSDRDPAGLASIAAWRADTGHDNLLPPVPIDLDDPDWFRRVDGPFDLIFASNVLHISPWRVTLGLLAGAGHLLADHGALVVYGCFSRSGDFVSDSNREFDRAIRERDPEWGVRDTDDVAEVAARNGLTITRIVPMPANNTILVLRRDHSGSPSSS